MESKSRWLRGTAVQSIPREESERDGMASQPRRRKRELARYSLPGAAPAPVLDGRLVSFALAGAPGVQQPGLDLGSPLTRRLSVGFSSSSSLFFGPRNVQLWIYCRGACSSSLLLAASSSPSSTTTTSSSSSSSSSATSSSSFLTLFGDGYSWVDNTDYVVIA
ncbi:hypothetical protein lerEdw1_020165 [Lerista edwardsae]|nr:hypothetical protein lerEdw1_020165 [Lerista edwardsae]